MSTKIHNGSIVHKTFMDTYPLIEHFRKKVQMMAQEKINTEAVKLATGFYDLHTMGLDKEKTSPILRAMWLINDAQNEIERTNRRNPQFDMSCELLVFLEKNRTLVIVESEQRQFLDFWLSIPSVNEYMYFNNTDKPDKISEKDWDKRYDDWMQFLDRKDGAFFPAPGLTVKCVNVTLPCSMDRDDLRPLIPDFEKRVEMIAMELVYDIVEKELIAQHGDKIRPSMLISHMGKIEAEVKDKCREDVRSRLTENVTIDTLFNSL